MYEFATKRAKSHNVFLKKMVIFLIHFSIGEVSTMSLYIRFLSTCLCDRSFFSLTESIVGGGKILMWQNLFLWQNFFPLTETRREIFSLMETHFLKNFGFLTDSFVWKKPVSVPFFLWRQFISVIENFFCYNNLFLWQKIVLSKILFFGDFLRDFHS